MERTQNEDGDILGMRCSSVYGGSLYHMREGQPCEELESRGYSRKETPQRYGKAPNFRHHYELSTLAEQRPLAYSPPYSTR